MMPTTTSSSVSVKPIRRSRDCAVMRWFIVSVLIQHAPDSFIIWVGADAGAAAAGGEADNHVPHRFQPAARLNRGVHREIASQGLIVFRGEARPHRHVTV